MYVKMHYRLRYGVGVDNVDLSAAKRQGIPVCNVPDYCIDEVADYTIAMILDLTRRITQNALTVRGGGWGLAVEPAQRLKPFKCRVIAADPGRTRPGSRRTGMGNVLITSHVASVSEPSGTLRTSVANTVAAAITSEKLPNVVNGVGA